MTEKEKALTHVRSVCPELMKLSFGCEIKCKMRDDDPHIVHADVLDTDEWKGWVYVYNCSLGAEKIHPNNVYQINGHTPHIEHWLRGMEGEIAFLPVVKAKLRFYAAGKDVVFYDLTKDGDEQSEEFYQAYNDIIGL